MDLQSTNGTFLEGDKVEGNIFENTKNFHI